MLTPKRPNAQRSKETADYFQFPRKVKIFEAKVFRNWLDLEVKSRKAWKDMSDDEVVTIRLWLHEVFALATWRQRDGGKEVSLPVINDQTREKMQKCWKRAEAFLAESEDTVEAVEKGPEKDEMELGLEWMQLWLEHVREKLEGDAGTGDTARSTGNGVGEGDGEDDQDIDT